MAQIRFFALREDMLEVCSRVESSVGVHFIVSTIQESAEFSMWASGAELSELGVADEDSGAGCRKYLVVKAGREVHARTIDLMDGGTRFAMDQLVNPDSIVVVPAGARSIDTILSGSVGTASTSSESRDLFRRFQHAIKRCFRRHNAYWIGPKAWEWFEQGKRLTIAVQSPPESDLRPD
jgi:hypothetical protein